MAVTGTLELPHASQPSLLTPVPTGRGLWIALTFFPSPSWPHKAFFSPQSLLHPAWELLGKRKEPATEEEAEIQLMVPNGGRDVSGWKN